MREDDGFWERKNTLRAIANFHPFIVAGNPGTLSLLREMGFKTFTGFIDESYDEIENPEERGMMVISEVKRLCSLSENEIHEWYLSLLPILTYNAEHLLHYIPVWIRQRMGAEILYKFRTYSEIFSQ